MSFASFPLKKYQILKEIARQIYHSCEISIYQYLYHTVSFRFQFTTVAQISIYHGSSEMVISIYPISNFNLPQQLRFQFTMVARKLTFNLPGIAQILICHGSSDFNLPWWLGNADFQFTRYIAQILITTVDQISIYQPQYVPQKCGLHLPQCHGNILKSEIVVN